MAGTGTGRCGRLLSTVVAGLLVCCLGVGVVFGATLLGPVAPAAANQVSDLQAQAQQLSRQMLLEQLQIGGYQQQHDAAVLQAEHDQQLLAQTQARIQHIQQRIGQDTADLQHEAVTAYIEAGTATNSADPLFGNQQAGEATAVYDQVVTGDISVTVDQLQTDRATLRGQEAVRQGVVAQDQAAEAQASTMLAKAQSTEQALQQQSSQVNGQLAAALAQQQAAQEAAAAAALAAAQAAARAQEAAAAAAAQKSQVSATATAAQDLPGAPAGSSAAAPALNAFLQCVVQAESSGNYQAVSPTGQYMGAFQFSQATWNQAALLAGMPGLVGVPPNTASPADQDALAVALYSADGQQPWYDPCRSG